MFLIGREADRMGRLGVEFVDPKPMSAAVIHGLDYAVAVTVEASDLDDLGDAAADIGAVEVVGYADAAGCTAEIAVVKSRLELNH